MLMTPLSSSAQCQTRKKKNKSIKEKVCYINILLRRYSLSPEYLKHRFPFQDTVPLELIGMDLVGKLSENGHQYICVMVDYCTKWSKAYPLKYKFGAPKLLLTDQGREFVNRVI